MLQRLLIILLGFQLASCAVIGPGEIGVKQKFGKLSERSYDEGTVWYNPLTTKVVKTDIQKNRLDVE